MPHPLVTLRDTPDDLREALFDPATEPRDLVGHAPAVKDLCIKNDVAYGHAGTHLDFCIKFFKKNIVINVTLLNYCSLAFVTDTWLGRAAAILAKIQIDGIIHILDVQMPPPVAAPRSWSGILMALIVVIAALFAVTTQLVVLYGCTIELKVTGPFSTPSTAISELGGGETPSSTWKKRAEIAMWKLAYFVGGAAVKVAQARLQLALNNLF